MVGGNPPNHLGDFEEGIRIRALFSRGQCGPCVICGERGLGEGLGGFGIHLRFLGDVEFSLGEWSKIMEKKKCTLCVILMKDG